jgi:dihydrodipicolinate synthase/N-acetylneuraminate lyase
MRGQREIRDHLQGPICSVPTTFTREGEIDEVGIRRVLDVAIGGGTRAVMLTWFDSLFSVLTDEEVYRVTQLVVGHVARRVLTIAADRSWWTGKTVEFARWCRDLGTDIVMVRPPDMSPTTPQLLAAHYSVVSEVMPLMLVGRVPEETMAILAEQAPGVAAFKEDIGGNYGLQVARHYAGRWAMVSAGHKWAHYMLWPYGCAGWLSNFISFAPQVAQAYWSAVQTGDIDRVKEVLFRYDEPWWDMAAAFPGGADGLWHATLEVFGIAGRWRRSPYVSAGLADVERARAFYGSLGLV